MPKKNENEYDVALVGGSLIEHMAGKELGQRQTQLKRDEDVFESLFTKQGGGAIEGMALGISQDRISNLLYRLRMGELTYTFRPKVWWVAIGTKDWEVSFLLATVCSS